MTAQKRSPSETLMAALEEFGKDEPIECLLIFTTQAGDICQMSSTDVLSTKLGMLEISKFYLTDGIRGLREQ